MYSNRVFKFYFLFIYFRPRKICLKLVHLTDLLHTTRTVPYILALCCKNKNKLILQLGGRSRRGIDPHFVLLTWDSSMSWNLLFVVWRLTDGWSGMSCQPCCDCDIIFTLISLTFPKQWERCEHNLSFSCCK